MKINNKGFALVETLIVTVFVMSIFSLMYVNFFPMIGEYEKREKYDDIDSVYNTYLIKRMLEDTTVKTSLFQTFRSQVSSTGYSNVYKCSSLFSDTEKVAYCNKLFEKLDVKEVYLTPYNITNLKNNLSNFNSYLQDYIKTLPNYTKSSNYSYRIIVQYIHKVNNESNDEEDVYSFSTMGVDF